MFLIAVGANVYSKNPLEYRWLSYNVNTQQWVEGFDGPWALWSPRPGIYWTHFEAYDENGNLSDVKTYAFGV